MNYNFIGLRSSPKIEIVIIEENLKKSNINTLKKLKASKVISKFLEEWILKQVMEVPKVENRKAREIIEEEDGSIELDLY